MVDFLKSLLSDFDVAALLPELSGLFQGMEGVLRLAVMAGPLCLLGLGLWYLLLPPAEANHNFGYRCFFGMGSVDAWRFTQRLSGAVLGGLGLILTGVMLMLGGSFPGMDPMEMVWRAFWCLIWQGVLALLANGVIWAITAARFDARGNLRQKNRKK